MIFFIDKINIFTILKIQIDFFGKMKRNQIKDLFLFV